MIRPEKVKRSQSAGFTILELMVALVLSLIIIAGVISIFLANKQSYRTNEGLGEIQDGARTAFELMARDIRTSGLTGCINNGRVANILTGGQWWKDWNNPLIGYESGTTDPAVTTGTAAGNRLAGTDSIAVLSVEGAGLGVKGDGHDTASYQFTMNESTSDLQLGDIAAVCDPDHVTIFQITAYNDSGANITMKHAASGLNSTNQMGFPTGTFWKFADGSGSYGQAALAQIAKVNAIDWYVGVNPQGGTSLYRVQLVNIGNVPTPTPYEMIRNVTDMEISYHESGNSNFSNASSVANWANVDAVRVQIQLASENNVGTDNAGNRIPLTRDYTSTTTIRNRVN